MSQVIDDAIKDIDQIQTMMGRVKAIFVALGTIGVGAMIAFFAPPDLREEIPIHQEIGIGFMIFGGLFSLALFADTGPGSIGQRAKSLLLGVITGVLAVGCAISQLGPYGSVGYLFAVTSGLFSLSALWEVVSGRPSVTANPE